MPKQPKGDFSHHSATLDPVLMNGPGRPVQRTFITCDGCGERFPAYLHPVERQYDSPGWVAHAKRKLVESQQPA